ncbi:transcription regulator GAL80 [Lachancea thermotolerans CBS 6340]|uniref:KLTH0C02838p n=1 Tax=Lachancea thermotolerans (strain ATCC 56472 / CBS 6340 / NRRL Y-8284) TaxID=559295 RepID=C5DDQ2_LACTC|nr:KLTH0C02838p [Lachancea thermotolerans CBS 6340]CAR21913.1 KLTH0C02838p [Lachancea thermotolerans CBS 6340]
MNNNKRSYVSTVPKANPLRVGFIGLSAYKGWAIKSHYPAILQLPSQFQVTALLNLDIETSLATIKKLKLTKATAFSDVSSFASYDNVDMVVISVNVPELFTIVMELLENSKANPNLKYIYSEWSLGKNLKEAEAIHKAAKERGVQTIISLQGRKSPYVVRAKELVSEGCIGDINSIEIAANGGWYGYERPIKSPKYLYDAASGVSLLSIAFGHTIDILQYITASYFSEINAMIFNNIPYQVLLDEHGKKTGEKAEKTAPDHLLFQGSLSHGNVPVSCSFKGGTPVKKFSKNLVIDIHGTKGDLKLEGDAGFAEMSNLVLYFCGLKKEGSMNVSTGSSGAETMEVYHLRNYNSVVGNILRIYEAIADFHFRTNPRTKLPPKLERQGFLFEGFPTFKDALIVHQLIQRVIESSQQKTTLPTSFEAV